MTEPIAATPGSAERLLGGRFTLERELGRGASATTWLARDAQTGRQVAVKALHARRLEDWKQLELFEREARVLGGLRHHGVPELIAFFEEDATAERGPELYLVMEWIDGVSLAELIARGPRLGQVEAMQLASDVLDVLVYLHGRTPPVYHRDLKPSNIVLRQDGTPVLIDFGGVCDGWRAPTDSGDTIVGTVGYMPPEQYLGQVGPWSDLYALGATLLHLLTGRAPADHDFASGRLHLPAGLEVHPRLGRLIEAVLEPAPRDRPQSASAARALLLTDVAPLPAPTPAAPTSAPERATASAKPRRLMNLGPPPRDPTGPRAALYRQLRGSYSAPLGCALHVVMLAGVVAAVAVKSGLGVAIAIAAWVVVGFALKAYNEARDKTLPPDGTPGARLFIHGRYAVARIVSREESGNRGFRLHYVFEADELGPDGETRRAVPIRGHFDVPTLVGLANPPGTELGVLHDDKAPGQHSLVKQDLAPGV